jgi:hypothetical protein
MHTDFESEIFKRTMKNEMFQGVQNEISVSTYLRRGEESTNGAMRERLWTCAEETQEGLKGLHKAAEKSLQGGGETRADWYLVTKADLQHGVDLKQFLARPISVGREKGV